MKYKISNKLINFLIIPWYFYTK